MISEQKFIADQLLRICDGEAWYGDSVFAILKDIGVAQASARPISNAHTIWEIVLHMTGWCKVDCRRLKGEIAKEPPEGDWPEQGTSEAEWKTSLDNLRKSIIELSEAAKMLSNETMEKILARGSSTYRGNLHGALQHVVYHSAQIAILKKSLI
jgi:uncharacterized damage-inducible protein DinB